MAWSLACLRNGDLGRGYTELFEKLAVFHLSFFIGYTGGKKQKGLKTGVFYRSPPVF